MLLSVLEPSLVYLAILVENLYAFSYVTPCSAMIVPFFFFLTSFHYYHLQIILSYFD